MAVVPRAKRRDKHITKTFDQGISNEFDCTVLFYCLLSRGIGLMLRGARRKDLTVQPFYQSERVDQLRECRNALAHATRVSLPEAGFRARIQDIEHIYH